MKKGFTVVELIVSFSLTMVIVVFLFQIVISLKNIYTASLLKTELINKQAIISDKINTSFNQKTINRVTKCGSYCLKFIYSDNTSEILKIDSNENSFQFGTYKTLLPDNSYFKNVSLNIASTGTFDKSENDSILILDLPIYNDILKDQNFGVKIVYQFNEDSSNIYSVDFDENSNEYGYIALTGAKEISLSYGDEYKEYGYYVYDVDGNIIDGAKVVIDNPIDDNNNLPPGNYEIIYSLYDEENIVYQTRRKLKIYMDSTLTNIVKNPGFETDDNWTLSNASYVTTESYSGNRALKFESGALTAMSEQATTYKPIYGHKYYGRLMFKSSSNFTSNDDRYELIYKDGVGSVLVLVHKNTKNSEWHSISNIVSLANDNYVNQTWRFRNFIVNGSSVSYADDLLLIDLTSAFGAGKEPSKEWCDENIPFFENQYNLIINK